MEERGEIIPKNWGAPGGQPRQGTMPEPFLSLAQGWTSIPRRAGPTDAVIWRYNRSALAFIDDHGLYRQADRRSLHRSTGTPRWSGTVADGAAEICSCIVRAGPKIWLLPPGNRLEKFPGDRNGPWSVRINDQWRICFVWRNGNAWDVEIVNHHYYGCSIQKV